MILVFHDNTDISLIKYVMKEYPDVLCVVVTSNISLLCKYLDDDINCYHSWNCIKRMELFSGEKIIEYSETTLQEVLV